MKIGEQQKWFAIQKNTLYADIYSGAMDNFWNTST